ncbi:MAG: hypothetical protein QOJ03_1913 [Frankiaceae bacterium]|nr:hypothetical protein [Frankiaceae bacterium]
MSPASEDYVRPPLIAAEPRSPRPGRWWFRIVFGLVLLALVAALVLLVRWLTGGNGEGSPGVNNATSARIQLIR